MDNYEELDLMFETAAEPESNTKFVIDTEKKAEWASDLIARRNMRILELKTRAKEKCQEIMDRANALTEPLQKDVDNLTELLRPFVEQKVAALKKGKSFGLLNGAKLGLKKKANSFEYDEDKLLKFFGDNKMDEFIKTETVIKPKWGEFKKACTIESVSKEDELGNTYEELVMVVKDTGELVPVVKVTAPERDEVTVDVKGIEL